MGPSVLFPALSSSVLRTNLKRQQRAIPKGVMSLAICVTDIRIAYGLLIATNRNVGQL